MNRSDVALSVCARRGAVIAVLLLTAGGCGPSDWGSVEGVVTLGGKPIGPGTLVFEPLDPGLTRSGMAHFSEDGRYELKSGGNEPGLPIGEYRIRVHGQGGESFGEERVGPPPKSSIPQQYLNYGAGLTATIEDGNNTINFELQQ